MSATLEKPRLDDGDRTRHTELCHMWDNRKPRRADGSWFAMCGGVFPPEPACCNPPRDVPCGREKCEGCLAVAAQERG